MGKTNLDEKLKIIEMFSEGKTYTDIAEFFNISRSAVCKIIKNRQIYQEYDGVVANKLTRRVVSSVINKDLSALELVRTASENNIPITGNLIIQRASSAGEKPLSRGWFHRFKKRNLIKRVILEPSSTDNSQIKVRASERSLYTQSEFSENTSLTTTLSVLNPLPFYIENRLQLWEIFKKQYENELAEKQNVEIVVQTKNKDGKIRKLRANSWKSTPFDIAKLISTHSWCNSVIIAKVDGVLWDLERPLEKDCSLEFLTFEDDECKQVFWSSSAHIMGQALEKLYGCHLCDKGIPVENGFFYDAFMINEIEKAEAKELNKISKSHFPFIESLMKTITNEEQSFERLELSKEQLIELFSYNQFKMRVLEEKIKEQKTTVYRCGTFIDLCIGPHVRHTGFVKAIKITQLSSSYWEDRIDAEPLERVYGISFPNRKLFKEWQGSSEALFKKEDFYRKLGKQQSLFFFNETYSPGSYFFTPHGTHIYNTLVEFIRSEYRKRNIQEVITPNMFNMKLYDISGHSRHYQDSMIPFELEKEKFAFKPMNCPGHCLIFSSTPRTLSDLPMRLADFGVLHGKESEQTATSIRRFQQDDAHIFCTPSQISNEIRAALDFINCVYSLFGFSYELRLSTRPESYMGEIEQWDFAEKILKVALDLSKFPWKLSPGEGAFYGPKIDITINDAMHRPFQCGTIQLDFQMPIQFNLRYSCDDGTKRRPVIIHRAILGSIERFIAILTENFAGNWPFWLSPRQAIVLLDGELPNGFEYAEKVRQCLYEAGFEVEAEIEPSLTINRKIQKAQLAKFNFLLVIGPKQVAHNTVEVRTRENKVYGEVSIEFLLERFKKIKQEKVLNSYELF